MQTTAIVTILAALKYDFFEIFDIFKCVNSQKSTFKACKNVKKGSFLTFWNQSNLISRKIWVTGKSCNLYPVNQNYNFKKHCETNLWFQCSLMMARCCSFFQYLSWPLKSLWSEGCRPHFWRLTSKLLMWILGFSETIW